MRFEKAEIVKFLERIKKGIGNLSYKYVICLCLLLLIGIFIIAFGGYTYYGYQKECEEIAGREAVNTASQLVSQVDERFDNLKQYYVSFVDEEDMKWILENDLHYSDYSKYTAAAEVMAGKKIFGDYISGYTFVNFKTGWVLSSKGMFPLEEAANGGALQEYFQKNSASFDRNYWNYNENEIGVEAIDRSYRVTIDTTGLCFVMRLPSVSVKQYGMCIINVNLSTWKNWISQCLGNYENVVVLNSEGTVIYATDESLSESSIQLQAAGLSAAQPQRISQGEQSYMVSSQISNVLGWEYYVYYDMDEGQFIGGAMSLSILFALLFLVIACFFMVSYTIYRPVGRLVRDVSAEDVNRKPVGNELEFLAGRFADLKDDKQTLVTVLEQQRDRLQELFELRLIRGEVRSEEEWTEYFEGLHLSACKYFVSAVMVLNLRGENETQSNVNEDAICLKLVAELPEALKELTWMPIVYNACTIFCLFGADDEDEMMKRVLDFYDGIQEFAEGRYGYRVLMGVSATHTDFRHIRSSYRESIHALTMQSKWHAAEAENGRGAGPDAGREDCHFFLSGASVQGNAYDSIYEKDIQAAIKAMDKDQCYKVIDEFSVYLRDISSHDEAMIYILRMVNAILLAAVSTRLNIDKLYPDGLKKVYYRIIEVLEPSRVRRYLKTMLIDPVLEARTALLEDNSYLIMEEIENKIRESRGNITLTECAEALGVHPTYIWKVLKMEKGRSFSDYLEEYKIEEAKRLLLQTSMSVAEIAAELNYTNAQNFIRFFSKSTGVTPGKYRKLF